MLLCFNFSPQVCYAQENTNNTKLEDELTQNIYESIKDLNLDELEEYFNQNAEQFDGIFGISDYKEFLLALIGGEILTDFSSISSSLVYLIKDNLSAILSPLLLILIIILISVVFKNVRPQINSSAIAETVFFICFSVVVSILVILFAKVLSAATQSITKMQNQMNCIFPILMLLMNGAGASITVKAYQPLVLLLSNVVSNIFSKVLLPIVITIFVLSLVDNLSPQTKVKNLIDFFTSGFKWIIGIVFTIYMAFMAIQGITASSADGISIKTAKYAIKNYIPMLGGYISDGFEVARVGSVIIKNAIGFSGIIFLIITIISPIIFIGILQLALKLIAALAEPIADGRSTGLLSSVSKSLSLLITVVIGVAVMYFIIIFLLMCSVSGVV